MRGVQVSNIVLVTREKYGIACFGRKVTLNRPNNSAGNKSEGNLNVKLALFKGKYRYEKFRGRNEMWAVSGLFSLSIFF